MKRWLFAAVIGASVVMTGCGQKSEMVQSIEEDSVAMASVLETQPESPVMIETTEEPTVELTAVSTAASTAATAEGTAETRTDEPAEEDGRIYYGDWLITACKGTSAVYALSQEEIDERVGTVITYQPASYSWNGNEMAVQGYEEDTVTREVFQNDFGISLYDLEMTNEEMLSVGVIAEGDLFGGQFYALDKNTLMVYYEGVFFEGVRF